MSRLVGLLAIAVVAAGTREATRNAEPRFVSRVSTGVGGASQVG